ncbi:uncharacterized protein [Euwallacea similis]|uniref:uncharacterized protein n=1 Tax=Euwallacea similis TaxID=1736056 RepID=UPI00344CD7BC
MMLRIYLTVLCLLSLFQSSWNDVVKLQVDKIRVRFLEVENELWNHVNKYISLYKSSSENEKWLISKFALFDKDLRNISSEYSQLFDLRHLEISLILCNQISAVDRTYESFRGYMRFCSNPHDNKLTHEMDQCNTLGLVNDINHRDNGILRIINRMHKTVFDGENNLLHSIKKILKCSQLDNRLARDISQSVQQLYYNLYNVISIVQLKAYILLQFSNLRNMLLVGNYTNILHNAASTKRSFLSWTQTMHQHLSLAEQDRTIQKCDPSAFRQGQNFDKFTRLLQGHIENEADMNKDRRCIKSCNDYTVSSSYGCYEQNSSYCNTLGRIGACRGTIRDCFFVDSEASICFSNHSIRRRDYEYIKFKNGITYGLPSYCPKQTNVSSWTRGLARCHYCICLCASSINSHRHICLKMATANSKTNRIVTGVKFVKLKQILHIQIQEGKLLPYGVIDQNTVRWVDLDTCNLVGSGQMLGKDYFMMTYSQRSMALDDLEVDGNYVITGVGFKFTDGVIHLQMYTNPFDWITGKINHRLRHSISKGIINRFKINIEAPDIPTRTKLPSQSHNNINRLIEFTHSDFGKDAAQNTIPFLDIQEVVAEPAVPLSGVGIYYKGNEGYGGFVAPRIKTYNYGSLVSTGFPEKCIVKSLLEV